MSTWLFVVLAPVTFFLYTVVGFLLVRAMNSIITGRPAVAGEAVGASLLWPFWVPIVIVFGLVSAARHVASWEPTKRVNLPQAKVVSK